MKNFRGKVAIITGGASGIGRAIGKALTDYGATVVLSDVNEPLLTETAKALGAEAKVCDVTDAAAVAELVNSTKESHGRIDYMFNNAGIAVIGEALDMSTDDWHRMFDVNVRGVIHGITVTYPLMVEQGFGHIVNTASVSGLIAAPGFAAYSGTKHAVVGLSRSLRAEAKVYGVRVSAVCPGFIDTPIKDNAKVVSFDRETAQNEMPIPFYDVDDCARDTLKGVAANREIIVVAGHAKIMHALQRATPRLMEWVAKKQAWKNHKTAERAKGK